MPFGRNRKQVMPPYAGDVLVLLADRLTQPLELDLARLLGELLGMDEVLAVRVQRLEQRGREAAR